MTSAETAHDGEPIYKIVSAQAFNELEKTVNKLMDAGWEPHGGVAMCAASFDRIYYAQAMLKLDL